MHNIIGDNGAKYLGEGIAKCDTLTSLDLYLNSNNIMENGGKYLGEEITKCVSLTSFNLNL